MQLQNTFKQQRRLQNDYQKLIDAVQELPMSEDSQKKVTAQLLVEFKLEAKKIIDESTGMVEQATAELPEEVNGKEDVQL